jgi:hypothetical protein
LVLRRRLRRIDRIYQPLVAKAKGDEKESLIHQHWDERAAVEEELEALDTHRLQRLARKYWIVPPPITSAVHGEEQEDQNWQRGWASNMIYLKPAAAAVLYREIEDAKKRRREVFESWAKIIGGLITALVTLISVIALALR